MMKKYKMKSNNRGSSLIMVIASISLVAILAMVIMATSVMNIQMRAVGKYGIDTFYDAEVAMDEIRTGLQQEVSLAATTAYWEVLQNYSSTNYQNTIRQNTFIAEYRDELKNRLGQAADNNKYDVAKLRIYISSSHLAANPGDVGAYLSTKTGKDPVIAVTKKGVILKDLELTYLSANDYLSVVNTDIVLGYPAMNFTQSASVPDLLSYCVVGGEGITAQNGTITVNLEGNVYAGSAPYNNAGILQRSDGRSGFTLTNASKVELGSKQTIIMNGGLNLDLGTRFTTGTKVSLWADNINLTSNSSIDIAGAAFVSDDMNLSGNADVVLRGEYYGYGNPNTAALASSIKDEDVTANPADYSSAILINGISGAGKSRIHMNGLTTLMLAGNGYVGDGSAMMGESLTVKSNQIAYLAPAECFTVKTTNPTADSTLDEMETVIVDGVEEQQYKYVDKLKLAQYHASGVVKQVSQDGYSYYFLQFDSSREAAEFSQEYYQKTQNQIKREEYLGLYVNEKQITLRDSNRTNSILNGGIMIWDNTGITSLYPDYSATPEYWDMSDNQYYAQMQSGWQDMYSAYKCNLTTDYQKLSDDQRKATLFENLIDVDALNSMIGVGSQMKFSYTDGTATHAAYVVRNTTPFEVTSSFIGSDDVKIVIATGDVIVKTDFTGIILSGGQIVFDTVAGTTETIQSDALNAALVIQQGVYTDVSGTRHTLYEILKDSDYYAGDMSAMTSKGEQVDIAELVTYYNWSKE